MRKSASPTAQVRPACACCVTARAAMRAALVRWGCASVCVCVSDLTPETRTAPRRQPQGDHHQGPRKERPHQHLQRAPRLAHHGTCTAVLCVRRCALARPHLTPPRACGSPHRRNSRTRATTSAQRSTSRPVWRSQVIPRWRPAALAVPGCRRAWRRSACLRSEGEIPCRVRRQAGGYLQAFEIQ